MCDTKKCTKCGKELPLDQFYKRRYKNGKTGYRHCCKGCGNAAAVEWQKDNPGKVSAARARYREGNPEKARAACVKWRGVNPGYAREWRKNNSQRDKINAARYDHDRRATDISYRLIRNIRAAMNSALRYNTKTGHTIELLGCSMEYLRTHLENQFTEGMTWGNYGRYGWHIDHIIPVSYFDHSDPEQQKRAWHYTNLQPLWATDNLKKHNKIEERQLVLL